MNEMRDLSDFQVGDYVVTPSGRRAVVVKLLLGTSKFDCFSRLSCRYLDGSERDMVTLQPHHVRHLSELEEDAGQQFLPFGEYQHD